MAAFSFTIHDNFCVIPHNCDWYSYLHIMWDVLVLVSWASSAIKITYYGLDDHSLFLAGAWIFLITQPYIYWVSGTLSPGIKQPKHKECWPLTSTSPKNKDTCSFFTSIPLCVCMAIAGERTPLPQGHSDEFILHKDKIFFLNIHHTGNWFK
jgi:hypothetical protein